MAISVLRAAVVAGDLAVLDAEAELGREDHLVSSALQRASEELLVLERTVDLGGIEERHYPSRSQTSPALRLFVDAAKELAVSPRKAAAR